MRAEVTEDGDEDGAGRQGAALGLGCQMVEEPAGAAAEDVGGSGHHLAQAPEQGGTTFQPDQRICRADLEAGGEVRGGQRRKAAGIGASAHAIRGEGAIGEQGEAGHGKAFGARRIPGLWRRPGSARPCLPRHPAARR